MQLRTTEKRRTGRDGWVSEEESDEEILATESTEKKQVQLTEESSATWWRRAMLGLPRMQLRSETLPRIGQQCLVLTGKAGYDEGQVAMIAQQKRCMVEIAFVGPKGDIRRKLKRPSTLLFLGKGVTVTQEQDGTMWVRAKGQKESK
jgi:hypothetical protein